MEINTNNILRAIELIKTIPEERIDMQYFRGLEPFNRVCQGEGSVIGFSTYLDTQENLEPCFKNGGNFDYYLWSEQFFGLSQHSEIWAFMFSGYWPNDKEQIIKRMQWIADGKAVPVEFSSDLEETDCFIEEADYSIILPSDEGEASFKEKTKTNQGVGFVDSKEQTIMMGDTIRVFFERRSDVYGYWIDYSLEVRGIVPVLNYLDSDIHYESKPKLSRLFSSLYDKEALLFITHTEDIRPIERCETRD